MPTRRCLYCQETIDKETLYSYLVEEDKLCYKCRLHLTPHLRKTKIGGINVNYLYIYDDYFKSYLLQYKEGCDEVLADIFLYYYKYYLKLIYWNYHVVLMPSTKEKIAKRGFNHLAKIYSPPLTKQKRVGFIEERCQEGLNAKERLKMLNNFYAVDKFYRNEKILLVDDVCTTGSSLKGAYNLLNSYGCQIKVFVLAIVQQKLKRKGFHF